MHTLLIRSLMRSVCTLINAWRVYAAECLKFKHARTHTHSLTELCLLHMRYYDISHAQLVLRWRRQRIQIQKNHTWLAYVHPPSSPTLYAKILFSSNSITLSTVDVFALESNSIALIMNDCAHTQAICAHALAKPQD